MSFVVSFNGWTPTPRYDDIPWTEARIEESATEGGVYAQIDVIALDPVDLDPSDPQARSFTTDQGTAAGLWYRIVFADAAGGTQVPTEPVQNTDSSAPYATVDELARILKIREPSDDQTAAMERVLQAAAGEINAEIDLSDEDGLEPWQRKLAEEVNLERAVEHWRQQESPFGLFSVGPDLEVGVARAAQNSWNRHAEKLAPLKSRWGLA